VSDTSTSPTWPPRTAVVSDTTALGCASVPEWPLNGYRTDVDGPAGARRLLGSAYWVFGGAAVGIASLQYLWRTHETAPFTWLWAIGSALLVVAVLSTALTVMAAGSRLSAIGLVLLVVGWLTLFFGIGALVAAAGFASYVAGLVRTRVIERHIIGVALILLFAAAATAILVSSQVPAYELAAAAAIVTGFGRARAWRRRA
jgi:hypothetical protein